MMPISAFKSIAKFNLCIYFIVIMFLIDCSSTPKPPISTDTLRKINEELESWAQGRWANFRASYDSKNSTLIIQVAALPRSNKIAWDGYCRVMKDLAQKYAPGYNFVGRVLVMGDVKKRCF